MHPKLSRHSLILVALSASFVVGCGKTSASTSSSSEGSSAKGGESEKAAKVEKAVAKKIGDSVLFEDDSEWIVLEAKDLGSKIEPNNDFEKAAKSEEGHFVRVKFSIKNRGKKEEMLFEGPKLVDSEGREFGHYEKEYAYIPKDAKTLSLEKIPVGIKKEFHAIYEVPKDAKKLQFQTRALEFGGDKTLVDLAL
jgi:hypothetical protein